MSLNLTEIRDRLLAAIDKAIAEGSWEASLFFKNILKQLLEIREYVAVEFTEKGEQAPTLTNIPQRQEVPQAREGYERLYIAVYQTEPGRLERWLSAIKMLVGYSVSRPVYRTEVDIQEMIRNKKSRSDAYVTVWIKQSDIIPPYSGAPLKDKWEHELLTLKEGCFKLENVIEFVHEEKHYFLHGDELVLISK